jgi:hypothetical protein
MMFLLKPKTIIHEIRSTHVNYHSAKDRVASNFKEGSPLRARVLHPLHWRDFGQFLP